MCHEHRRRRATKGNNYQKNKRFVLLLESMCGVYFWGIPVHLDIYVCSLYHFGADSVRHSGALWDVGSWAPRLHGPCQMPWAPHALSLWIQASGRGLRPRLHGPRPCGTHGPRPRGPGRHCMDPGCVHLVCMGQGPLVPRPPFDQAPWVWQLKCP
jgi:hypothetical protein